MSGVCTDRKEFFKTILENLRKTDSEYCDTYSSFDDVPESEWEELLEEYMQEIACIRHFERNIDVDFENVGYGGEYTHGGLNGVKSLPTGELFYCFDCGGDWECPVNAIVYVEDGTMKFHIPERGNNFNAKTRRAYGNEEDEDGDEDAQSMVEKNLNNRIDQEEELKEIAEFLHGGKEQGDSIKSCKSQLQELLDELQCLKSIVNARKEVFKSDWNGLYFVYTGFWGMRHGSNDNDTISANGCNAYHNVFKTHEEALDYVHTLMMINHHDQLHNWEQFSQTISIVENDEIPEHSCGYVHHPMQNGVERFEGFDVSGNYPCLVDDFIIVERAVHATKTVGNDGSLFSNESTTLKPVQVSHRIKDEHVSEFTQEQEIEHQKELDKIVDEMGGIDSLFEDKTAKNGELDKIKDILGWNGENDK